MATKDFSTVPATVTITNTAEQTKLYDAGSLQRAKTSDIQVDADGHKYVLSEGTRKVQLHRINTQVELPVGDSVKLYVDTTEEVAYYSSLANDELTVLVEEIVTETAAAVNTEVTPGG